LFIGVTLLLPQGVMGLFGTRFMKPAVTPAPTISEEEAPV
jgi:hypothetical protein